MYFIIKLFLTLTLISSSYQTIHIPAWQKFENWTHQSIVKLVKNFENDFTTILDKSNVTDVCRNSLKQYMTSLKKFDFDSLRMLDSSGRIPSGLLEGTFTDLGAFDECISMNTSQYCLMFTKMPPLPVRRQEGFMRKFEPHHFNFSSETFLFLQDYLHYFRYMNITTGICVPRGCDREELKIIFQEGHKFYGTGLRVDVDLCEMQIEETTWTPYEIVSVLLIVAVLAANFAGHYWAKPGSPLYAFNVKENLKSLFKPRSVDDSIGCLNGIKAITLISVIIAHFQLGYVFAVFSRSFDFTKLAADPVFLVVYLAPYTVDSFFVVAGLVNSLYFFQSKRFFSLIPYLLTRWMRFAPLLVWTLACQFLLFSKHMQAYMGGPLWGYFKATGGVIDACQRTWPTSLLLIQYWFDSPDDINLCFVFDWYLDVDYFFSVIFLLILVPYLKKYKSIALLNTLLLIFGGLIISGLMLHFLDLPHTWIVTDFQEMDLYRYTWLFNLKPWAHITPYFIGVLLGFVLSKSKTNINKSTLITFWTIFMIFLTIIIGYEVSVNRWSIVFPYGFSLVYGMTSKSIWAACVAWIIYATHNGYFLNRINSFLSNHIFVVLSRINLSLLCMHLMFVRLRTATYRSAQNPTYFDQLFYSQLPTFVIVYIVAFVTAILVEAPSIKLMKMLLKPKSRTDRTTTTASSVNRRTTTNTMSTSGNLPSSSLTMNAVPLNMAAIIQRQA